MGFLILVSVSLLAAVPGGRIRNRPTAALVGFGLAFCIFAAPWMAWGIGLFGRDHLGVQEDLRGAIAYATVFGIPVAVLGACVALIANTVWYPQDEDERTTDTCPFTHTSLPT